MPVNRVSRKQLKLLRLWMKQDGRAAFSPTELRPHSPNQRDAKSPVFMRLCTNCISCMELPLLPKRARFLSEPPPNRLQTSKRTSVLLRTIPADGQDENKGKPRKDILTASVPARKRRRLDGGCLDSRPSQEQYTSRRQTPFVTHFSEDSRFLTSQQFHTP